MKDSVSSDRALGAEPEAAIQGSGSFTPGPWEWVFNSTGGQWALVHRKGSWNTVYVKLGAWPDAPLSPDQRLIAAAPELLSAALCASNVLSLLEAETAALGFRARHVPLLLRAAIAKATGSQP